MFTRKWAVVLIAVLLALPAASAFGAPYVYVSVLGRISGSSDDFSSVVAVGPSQNIEYQVVADWAVFGTTNSSSQLSTANKTLTSLYYGRSGLTALTFDLYEAGSTENIQVALGLPTLAPGTWNGTLSSSGAMVAGTGTRNGNDISGIYANTNMLTPAVLNGVGSGGVAVQSIVTTTGTATVMSLGTDPKADALIRASVPTASASTVTMTRINATSMTTGTSYTASKTWTDPIVGYNALTLYQPWAEADFDITPPSSVDVAAGGELDVSGIVGYSSHTTGLWHWTIDGLLVPGSDGLLDLSLDNAELKALLGALPERKINVELHVMTGDLQTASRGAEITLMPEPATMALLGLGGLALAIRRRRRVR
jgi:hypothetical protein